CEGLDQNRADGEIEHLVRIVSRALALGQVDIAVLAGVVAEQRVDQIVGCDPGGRRSCSRILEQAVVGKLRRRIGGEDHPGAWALLSRAGGEGEQDQPQEKRLQAGAQAPSLPGRTTGAGSSIFASGRRSVEGLAAVKSGGVVTRPR